MPVNSAAFTRSTDRVLSDDVRTDESRCGRIDCRYLPSGCCIQTRDVIGAQLIDPSYRQVRAVSSTWGRWLCLVVRIIRWTPLDDYKLRMQCRSAASQTFVSQFGADRAGGWSRLHGPLVASKSSVQWSKNKIKIKGERRVFASSVPVDFLLSAARKRTRSARIGHSSGWSNTLIEKPSLSAAVPVSPWTIVDIRGKHSVSLAGVDLWMPRVGHRSVGSVLRSPRHFGWIGLSIQPWQRIDATFPFFS